MKVSLAGGCDVLFGASAGAFNEPGTGEVADLYEIGLVEAVDSQVSLFFPGDKGALEQDAEMLTDVGMTGTDGGGELADAAGTVMEEDLDDRQARFVTEGAETGGNVLTEGGGEGRGHKYTIQLSS
jgi:hypothetical protein